MRLSHFNSTRNRMGKIRIIHGIFIVRAHVIKGQTFSFEKGDQLFFIIIPGMITTDGNGLREIKGAVNTHTIKVNSYWENGSYLEPHPNNY